MDFDHLFVLGIGGFIMYLMIFDTDRFNKANEAGWKNIERTGKVAKGAARGGFAIFKLFRRRM